MGKNRAGSEMTRLAEHAAPLKRRNETWKKIMKISIPIIGFVAVWSLAARCNNDADVKDARTVVEIPSAEGGDSRTDLYPAVSEDSRDAATHSDADLNHADSAAESEADTLASRVEEYLNTRYRAPLPWAFYQSLGNDAVPLFIAAIQDRNRSRQWENAVLALGYLGQKQGTRPLIELLEKTEGTTRSEESRALFAVPFSLALLAGQGDADALDYLIRHLPANSWDMLKWREGDLGELRDANSEFAADHMRTALDSNLIAALGMTKSPEALQALLNEKKKVEALEPQGVHIQRRLRNLAGAIQTFESTKGISYEEIYSSGDRRAE